ncbi:MAG: ArsC/Spx/MgsR family protein [Chloroflexota bacterium]
MGGRSGHARTPLQARSAQDEGLSGQSAPAVQIFGRRDSRPTQKALRFFRDRRISVVFGDLAVRPIAAGELRRFGDRLGAAALIDQESRAYRESGLGYMRLDSDEAYERVLANQGLLRLPLVRAGNRLSIGLAEDEWLAWLKADQ